MERGELDKLARGVRTHERIKHKSLRDVTTEQKHSMELAHSRIAGRVEFTVLHS